MRVDFQNLFKALFGGSLLFFLILFGIMFGKEAEGQTSPVVLQVKNREIMVNGKKSQVYEIVQPNGVWGLFLQKGERFEVVLENQIDRPTGVHWHGLILPYDQDGVPFVSQYPIPPGGKYSYSFPLVQAGTFWMHAHYGLQEQKLYAAPLILRDPNDKNSNQQEVVIILSDFSFRKPIDIFKELRERRKGMSNGGHTDKKMVMPGDLNDVTYEAFLANWRTLSDPDVTLVAPEREVRLRIINSSSSTNFFILLGKLKGEVIATDGADCLPLADSQFELAVAQRLDIRLKIPPGEGVYPILAQGEGLEMQTGVVLATPKAQFPTFKEKADKAMGAITYRQELLLKGKNPLPKREINRSIHVNLGGNMTKYVWTINGHAWPKHAPLMVKKGERVELVLNNHTGMAHPMHLHGHVFQVTEINGQFLEGALRDTILVLPQTTVKVQFDADQPGIWAFHCHNLYHQYGGMMTTLNYEGFKGVVFTKVEIESEYEN